MLRRGSAIVNVSSLSSTLVVPHYAAIGTSEAALESLTRYLAAVNGRAVAIFAVGKAPANGQAFDEAMYAVLGGLAVTGGTARAVTGPVLPAAGDHPMALQPPVRH
ncbi:SDR family oxidoreductase [Streptomyces rubellomurinus]|uniref:Uncharacterized protein n=1 Tax=Streptomyces rubellomurinus (strain ATCC 31215) TaxID=359131 RepID=A0A0F2THK9_STRR3|nr:SDR family oxidoreductase [Streptomyces rubellomurinus]KJS61986.1 hypothetical protein VM95_11635 [Streptomyces rubellomurinus]